MRYTAIKTCDINNGPGIRVSLWTQGCKFRCIGCHNKSTWDLDGGNKFTPKELELICKEISKGQNLSILGGEPLIKENIDDLTFILGYLKTTFPSLNIWLWTGYKFEDVKYLRLMDYIDVIVDGRFIEERKGKYQYFGSDNQRVIDVQKSIKENITLLY